MRVSPCIGCGYCCMKVTCITGMVAYNKEGPNCPGLMWDEEKGRYWCRAVLDEPERTKARLKEQMAIGAGCSSSLFNEQRDACARGELPSYLEAMKEKK